MRTFPHCALLCLLLMALPCPSPALPSRPEGRIGDFAGVLDEAARSQVLAQIQRVEAQTGAEIALATVESLEGMSVEEYGHQLFNAWGVGKKGKDNGVLVLVCPGERKIRIEVGYGLEGTLPDGLAGQVIREGFIPHFKSGDYRGGILNGVTQVAAILTGEAPAPSEFPGLNAIERGLPGAGGALYLTLFFSVFVGLGFFMFGAGIASKQGFLSFWGTGFGGIPLLMSLFTPLDRAVGFRPPYFLVPLAVTMAWLGFRAGSNHPKLFRGSGRNSGGSGWVWGGGSGGGGFSSGGGGGFGGGSSGGGGASGSW